MIDCFESENMTVSTADTGLGFDKRWVPLIKDKRLVAVPSSLDCNLNDYDILAWFLATKRRRNYEFEAFSSFPILNGTCVPYFVSTFSQLKHNRTILGCLATRKPTLLSVNC